MTLIELGLLGKSDIYSKGCNIGLDAWVLYNIICPLVPQDQGNDEPSPSFLPCYIYFTRYNFLASYG